MRRRVEWAAAETAPPAGEVLALQGMPAEVVPTPRIASLLDLAMAFYLESAAPRAMVGEIGPEEFAEVYRGEGRNAPETPLGSVFPRADRLALFTATVGGAVSGRIRDLFDRREPALAAMLDAVASAAADRLILLLGEACAREDLAAGGGVAPAPPADRRVLAYSPGYCGWHVSGQGALFARLRPEEIGVTLNPSFLMEPLKSVSGVLVSGPAAIHRFAPAFGFCADCRDKPCRDRIAALADTPRSGGREGA